LPHDIEILFPIVKPLTLRIIIQQKTVILSNKNFKKNTKLAVNYYTLMLLCFIIQTEKLDLKRTTIQYSKFGPSQVPKSLPPNNKLIEP
jgi:hypothetical protein